LLETVKLLSSCCLCSPEATVSLADLAWGSSLGGRLEELRGRSVLVATKAPVAAALALVELDGVASRLVVCPPDLKPEHFPSIVKSAGANALVSDTTDCYQALASLERFPVSLGISAAKAERHETEQTEWILLTSGTTGIPKLVVHTLTSLGGAINLDTAPAREVVWSTFYDIRRYGGMQIFLRAVLGGSTLVLCGAEEPPGQFLNRASRLGVTHISGTPSHWRRALMSPAASLLAPRYVRLSGEIADQAILDRLRTFFRDSTVVHAFASTEAGVAFEVRDGLEGFPAELLDQPSSPVQMRVENGSLRIRSPRNAISYLGGSGDHVHDSDGFVDTRDMVELRGQRYYFVGRSDGIINVGGLKVHPEEVEGIINRHPRVQSSLVRARKSRLTGSLVVADVVIKSSQLASGSNRETEELRKDILRTCRGGLAPYKVPTSIRFVPSLEVTASGKLARI